MLLIFSGGLHKNFISRRAEYGCGPGYFGGLLPGHGFSFHFAKLSDAIGGHITG